MSATATFRFYAELNDLVAPERRQVDSSYSFDVAPSVKDAIEALGVPHTEVSVILADGARVGFAHRLVDGSRIAVYPRFRLLAAAPFPTEGPGVARFVVDGHLGTLARYLRLLGFDTLYHASWPDGVLAELSAGEGRILITKDRGLLKRRRVTRGMLVRSADPRVQVVEVVDHLDLAGHLQPFTRCLVCNCLLVPIGKEQLADRLDPGILARFDRFWWCPRCGRPYWEGSHHRHLQGVVAQVRSDAGVPS